MKKIGGRVVGILFAIIIVLVALNAALKKLPKDPVVIPVDTGAAVYINSGTVTPAVVVPTTGEVIVTYTAQPTKLAGNYVDNSTMLRAWATKNIKTIDIPAGVSNVYLTFTLAKPAIYKDEPGNVQLSIGNKLMTNGRLSVSKSVDGMTNGPIYTYAIEAVYTSDHPNGIDLSTAIGNTLTIQAWIGQSQNYIKTIAITYTK